MLKIRGLHGKEPDHRKSIQEKSLVKKLRSATAGLLLESKKYTKEKLWLSVVLAQECRHIVETCGRETGTHKSCREGLSWSDHMRMGAVEKDVPHAARLVRH